MDRMSIPRARKEECEMFLCECRESIDSEISRQRRNSRRSTGSANENELLFSAALETGSNFYRLHRRIFHLLNVLQIVNQINFLPIFYKMAISDLLNRRVRAQPDDDDDAYSEQSGSDEVSGNGGSIKDNSDASDASENSLDESDDAVCSSSFKILQV